jgi:HSP20 family protein
MKFINRDRRRPTGLMLSPSRFLEEPFDVFRSFFEEPFFSLANTRALMPAIDVSETDNEIRTEIEIAGYDPKNIQVEVDENMLIIRGKQQEEKEDKNKRYIRRERAIGEFYREIPLPARVDSEHASCRFKNGILAVTMPKKESKERKRLKVEEG